MLRTPLFGGRCISVVRRWWVGTKGNCGDPSSSAHKDGGPLRMTDGGSERSGSQTEGAIPPSRPPPPVPVNPRVQYANLPKCAIHALDSRFRGNDWRFGRRPVPNETDTPAFLLLTRGREGDSLSLWTHVERRQRASEEDSKTARRRRKRATKCKKDTKIEGTNSKICCKHRT
jgi:hypothetical protein